MKYTYSLIHSVPLVRRDAYVTIGAMICEVRSGQWALTWFREKGAEGTMDASVLSFEDDMRQADFPGDAGAEEWLLGLHADYRGDIQVGVPRSIAMAPDLDAAIQEIKESAGL